MTAKLLSEAHDIDASLIDSLTIIKEAKRALDNATKSYNVLQLYYVVSYLL